ncbi:MAG: hypothetical protein OQK09_15325 [Colwellia sp.]|nr:hypothetical protein [Colwellia sp.]MCW9082879.1 hypothetical protein [Colwellia sp.]
MTELAPIAIFAFNRPDLLEQTLQRLSLCTFAEDSQVYLFIDGPRNSKDSKAVTSCLTLAEKYRYSFRCMEVKARKINKGLASSLKSGISTVLEKNESIIVLEDDLIVEKCFIEYMNSQLSFYKENKNVGSISGFSTKVSQNKYFNYFHPRPCSWGWATWKDRWNQAVWSIDEAGIKELKAQKKSFNKGGEDLHRMMMNQLKGKINSWAILWSYTHFKHNWVTSYPTKSLLSNVGFGEDATHCKGVNPFPYQLTNIESIGSLSYCPIASLDNDIIRQVNKYHSNYYKLLFKLGLI